jgi:hypothetical protein
VGGVSEAGGKVLVTSVVLFLTSVSLLLMLCSEGTGERDFFSDFVADARIPFLWIEGCFVLIYKF